MSNLVINANSIYDRVIRIGRQTENLVSEITFNLNMWIEEYGAGECVLNVRRNGDGSAYPVPMTITDGLTTWTITDTDTAKKGRGEIQLKYTAGDKVKTSPIFTISCGESIIGDGEPPSGYADWLTEMNRMTAEVEAAKTSADQSAQTAQTAAGTAAEKASEAEQSANTASGFANNASASAQSASESAQAAARSAEQAAESVSDVEASAQAASQSAQSAEAAKTAAQTAEVNAQASEQTASEKASQAAEAQASADRARAEAEQAASRIYDFLPTDTANGPVASFSDGADNVPLKSLVVGINPVQDLHGYSSPWPAGGKGNILPTDTFESARGITVTRNADGSVTFSGTSTSAGRFFMWSGNLVLTEDYVFSVGVTRQSSFSFNIGTSESDNAINIPVGSSSVTVPAGTYVNWSVYIGANTPIDMTLYPMLKLSTDTDTTFFPYSNICPISGWTGMNLIHAGKNLWGKPLITGRVKIDGLQVGKTYTVTAQMVNPNSDCYCYVQRGKTGEPPTTYFYIIGGRTVYTRQLTPVEGYDYYIWCNNTWSNVKNLQIEEGSVDTDYEPYNGTEIPISWESEAGTIYGGSLDVLTGVLTVDRQKKRYTQCRTVSTHSFGNHYWTLDTSANSVNLTADNRSKYISDTFIADTGVVPGHIYVTGNGSVVVAVPYTEQQPITDKDVASQWLSENPIELVMPLSSPIEVQLTPHEVKTLLGANTIYADTGDTSVEYRADTTTYINRKIAEAISALS